MTSSSRPARWLLAAATGGFCLPALAVDRLTIVNSCTEEPIWIAHLANVGVGPGKQNVKIGPGQSHVFNEAETDGLGGARYWPKMGCDEQGNNCKLGGSGGPTQACVHGQDYSQCAPPIDTKFEATWGRKGAPCNPAVPSEMAGCDFVDISLVDGWTLPFKLEVVSGKCTGKAEAVVSQIDCSGLTLDKCPKDEDLGTGGKVDMTAISPHSHKPAGCYGPCLKLIDDKWGNHLASGRKREDHDVVPYCCTTPPLNSETCNAGPIGGTKYVQSVHALCPGVYGFAYDDGMGLMRCSYGSYKMTFFCPGGSAPEQEAAPPAEPKAPVATQAAAVRVVAPTESPAAAAPPAEPKAPVAPQAAADRVVAPTEALAAAAPPAGATAPAAALGAVAQAPAAPPQAAAGAASSPYASGAVPASAIPPAAASAAASAALPAEAAPVVQVQQAIAAQPVAVGLAVSPAAPTAPAAQGATPQAAAVAAGAAVGTAPAMAASPPSQVATAGIVQKFEPLAASEADPAQSVPTSRSLAMPVAGLFAALLMALPLQAAIRTGRWRLGSSVAASDRHQLLHSQIAEECPEE